MTDVAAGERRAGVLLPLFSFPSTMSWGIGDIGDIPAFCQWLGGAGQRVLQLLPLNEMATGQQSPYSAMSAMAIDPIFIDVASVPEFIAIGGEGALSGALSDELASVRCAPRIEYERVRNVKRTALADAFERFIDGEWTRDTERARAFTRFVTEQAWWIEDYALFRAIHAREQERSWQEWPEPLQRREPAAIDGARRDLGHEVLFYQYLQWLAGTQWQEARRRAGQVALFGDLPFMVDTDSADVWSRQQQFRFGVTVGVPPDAFSATGQDWGVPLYDWERMALDDYLWLRERARRSGDLFDGYRIDHLVGFYRTYGRPKDGAPAFFSPPDEPSQIAQGERLLGLFREAGAAIVAEDLGTVPDSVRASLARLGVPGFRVQRWEREWHSDGQPFRDPADYPPRSVATSGTHDTETLAAWWASASEDDRRKLSALPTIRRLAGGADLTHADFASTRDVLLEALYASGSDLLLLPLPDLFGWRSRINTPATIDDDNWSFRLPWPVDCLDSVPEARERRERLRKWVEKYGR
jgi:4-alpha-glucanotransferase